MDEPSSNAMEAPVVTPRKAPPKTVPPPKGGAEGDADAQAKKKKKAPPPPSGAPPKSAAAALRAKTGPPSSPPPKAVNASVQKIRQTAAPDGAKGEEAKPKKKLPPPASVPPDSVAEEKEKPSVPPTSAPPKQAPPKQAPPKQQPPLVQKKIAKDIDILGDAPTVETKKPVTEAKKFPAEPVFEHKPVPNIQHIIAQEKKTIMESSQGKRKTATELLQNDIVFRRQQAVDLDAVPHPELIQKSIGVYSSVSSNTTGKAAPQSLSNRRDHVEEELTVLHVKKEAKPETKPLQEDDDEDSMDDIEEIPIIDAKDMEAESKVEQDPEIVMEKAPCDEKGKKNLGEDEATNLLNNNQTTALPTSKAALTDALYQEMKQLESLGKQNEQSETEDKKDEKQTPEDKKRSKRSKQQQVPEEKKKSFELFNPKRVPYVPNHLLEFVTQPLDVGRGHIVRCFIERNRSGQNKISPLYTMLIEVNSSSGRPILYARKKPTSRISSHFVFSLNKDDLFLSRSLRSKQFVGKLRSDTRKMEYTLFDQGDNPEDIDSDCEIDEEVRQHIRAQLAVIRFNPVKKEFPRKMEVIIPAIVEHPSSEPATPPTTSYVDWRPVSKDQALETLYTEIAEEGGQNVLERDKFICLHKRESQYDPLSSCIVDFRSRATCVSVKNFQLVHSQPTDQERFRQAYIQAHPTYHYDDESTVSVPQEHILLQMGRVGQNCFNMDFQYPLSMLQAFAICIARFDCKQK